MRQKRLFLLLRFSVFLLVSFFYYYQSLLLVSPAVMAHSLMRDFRINGTALGIVSGIYFYSYTVMQIPAGVLYDHFEVKYVLPISCLVCTVGAILFALSPDVYCAIIARLIMGSGAAFAFLGVLYTSLQWFPIRYFAVFSGIAQTINCIGLITGQVPLALVSNKIGWRSAMMIFSLVGLLLSTLIWLLWQNCSKGYKKKITMLSSIGFSLKNILTNRQAWMIGLYSLFAWAPVPAFVSLWGVPFLMASYNIGNVAAANLCAMIWIGGAIGNPLMGYVSFKLQKRLLPIMISALSGMLTSIIIIYFHNIPVILLYGLLLLMGLSLSAQGLAFSMVGDCRCCQNIGVALGFNNTVMVFGGFLSQPLIGAILDMNWQGVIFDSHRLYSTGAYQIALTIIPICFFVAFIIAKSWIKETYSRSQFSNEASETDHFPCRSP